MARSPTPNRSSESDRSDAIGHLETEMAVLARRLEQAARRSATRFRLDRAGYLLARTIETEGPTSVNRLAQLLGLDGSTVTRQVATLTEKGFVTRRQDPSDGRSIVLTLTATGRREMEALRTARRRRLDETVADWPAEDVQTLATLLERLNTSLG